MMRLVLAVATATALPCAAWATTDLGATSAKAHQFIVVPRIAPVANFRVSDAEALVLRGAAASEFASGAIWLDDLSAENLLMGIPEPAAWAMLIAGFGLVGAMQRRRSASIAA